MGWSLFTSPCLLLLPIFFPSFSHIIHFSSSSPALFLFTAFLFMDKEVVSKFVKVSIWEVSGRQGVMYIGFIERETIVVKDLLQWMEEKTSGIDSKRLLFLNYKSHLFLTKRIRN